MCRCSRLLLPGPKDVKSTKAGTSGTQVFPCRHTGGLKSWAGKPQGEISTGSVSAAYVSKAGRREGRRCREKGT